jgi:glycosyltransferase involved in cell wall biosynthesis
VTAYKDVRAFARGRRFRRWVVHRRVEGQPAFVWSHHDLFQSAGVALARRLGVPLVQFVDALQVPEERGWGVKRPGWGKAVLRIGELPQLRAADVVACASDEVASAVLAAGIDRSKVVVAPNGVDLERYRPDVSGATVREHLKLDGALVIGWSGSFRPFHGLPTLLRAVAETQASHPEVAVLLVGDGQERPRTQSLAEELGLRNVRFTGTVPQEAMPAHLRAMDVAVLADDGRLEYHYSPLKLREYMAAGVPVVAPRIGEIDRSLIDGTDSLLVDPGNVRELADAFERLIDDAALRHRIAEAGRAKAVRDWSWDASVRKVQVALDLLASKEGVAR